MSRQTPPCLCRTIPFRALVPLDMQEVYAHIHTCKRSNTKLCATFQKTEFVMLMLMSAQVHRVNMAVTVVHHWGQYWIIICALVQLDTKVQIAK